MNTTRTLSAFLLGGAVGAALGVLFAPDKGSNTRRSIIGKKDELMEEAEAKVEEGKDYVKNKYQEGKDYVKNKYDEGKDKLSDITVKAKDKTNELRSEVEDYKTKTKQPGYSPS